MSSIADFDNPWRRILINTQASFRGVMFHVEASSRMSGRRGVVHEYPKRNDPYTEDMGRLVRRFNFSGYLVYRPHNGDGTNPILYDYVKQRVDLYEALEADDVGKLVHPVYAPNGIQALCDRYTMTETKDRGGFTQIEMSFIEYGTPVSAAGVGTNSKSQVGSNAAAAVQSILTLRG